MQENFVLTARREEIECVHSNKVYESVPMQNCNDAGKKLLDLIWVDTDKSVDPAHNKFRSTLCAREYKTKKQVKIQGAFLASQLFTAMPPLEAVKVLDSITISCALAEKRETSLKLRHCDTS